jgi:hypothetical protein
MTLSPDSGHQQIVAFGDATGIGFGVASIGSPMELLMTLRERFYKGNAK